MAWGFGDSVRNPRRWIKHVVLHVMSSSETILRHLLTHCDADTKGHQGSWSIINQTKSGEKINQFCLRRQLQPIPSLPEAINKIISEKETYTQYTRNILLSLASSTYSCILKPKIVHTVQLAPVSQNSQKDLWAGKLFHLPNRPF